MDGFYGGRQDLTAALGYELDGQTVILFRRKLNGKARIFPSILPPLLPTWLFQFPTFVLSEAELRLLTGQPSVSVT